MLRMTRENTGPWGVTRVKEMSEVTDRLKVSGVL